MTLQEWLCKYTQLSAGGIKIENKPNPETVEQRVYRRPCDLGYESLFHLTDYVVSSVCGESVILIPMKSVDSFHQP